PGANPGRSTREATACGARRRLLTSARTARRRLVTSGRDGHREASLRLSTFLFSPFPLGILLPCVPARVPIAEGGGMTRSIPGIVWLATAVAAVLAAAPVHAQVQPGDVITKANADKVKDLTSPGMFWCVQHGWPMKIVEAKPI